MAGENQDSNWPIPKFYFMVDWGKTVNIPFQEVSGLDFEGETLEYRNGSSPVFSHINMPGILKKQQNYHEKGVFANDTQFWDLYNNIKMNTIKRQKVVIRLLDQNGNPAMTWTLSNAWPTKISSTDLKSNGNEVAVESIELAHEGLTTEIG